MVAPPGQLSIYNALPVKKVFFILNQGHAEYPRQAIQEKALLEDLQEFSANYEPGISLLV